MATAYTGPEGLWKTTLGRAIRRDASTLLIIALWITAALAGLFVLARYAETPGQPANPPAHWPATSRLPRDSRLPSLVMFMHPHCPCSRASIGELAELEAHCHGLVKTTVLFLQPHGFETNWSYSDTWNTAKKIPGVAVFLDRDGREARLFGAETSGDTSLYDADGKLIFHGGITVSRGHYGDNAGLDAVQALLLGGKAAVTNTPAFGCPLFECPITNKPPST